MKLKIEHDSIRLRLSSEDIEQLVVDGRIRNCCRFGSEMEMNYLLEVGGTSLAASFDDRTLAVAIPRNMAETLTLRGGIGFERLQLNDDGSTLSIIVERDLGRKQPHPLPIVGN
jgi:hypothetical protein